MINTRYRGADARPVIDYERIKQLAKELGCPVPDLLALARQNDPFYVGTPGARAQAEWFAGVWQAGSFSRGAHLRRLHYWCVSQGGLRAHDGKPYENTEGCWQYLCQASKAARYLGLVDIADVADHKNPDPRIMAWYQDEPNARFEVNVPELADPDIWINGRLAGGTWKTGFNPAAVQPYHLEVWFEKSTMNDVLLPICQQYGANLITGEGEMSITAVYGLVQRLREADKPARIFYGSDFDPAGQSMPRAVARKIEWLLYAEGLRSDVKLAPLVLTQEQVQEYALPRTPIKDSEQRAARFEQMHGKGAVELDALEALHPGTLAGILEEALSAYYNREAEREARTKERALRQVIRQRVAEITGRYGPQIEALRSMGEELRALDVPDLERYEPDPAHPVPDDGALSWLFDSRRTYLEQIAAYKGYGNGGSPDAEA